MCMQFFGGRNPFGGGGMGSMGGMGPIGGGHDDFGSGLGNMFGPGMGMGGFGGGGPMGGTPANMYHQLLAM